MQLENETNRGPEPLDSLLGNQATGQHDQNDAVQNSTPAKSLRQPSLPPLPVPETLANPLTTDSCKQFCEKIGLAPQDSPHGASLDIVTREALQVLLQDPKDLVAVLVPGVMLQIRLPPHKCHGYDIRVHMFLDVVEPIVHNHARPFLSLLLYGEYSQKVWEVSEQGSGESVCWERRNGKFTKTERKGTAKVTREYNRKVGDVLVHGTKTYHTVEPATKLAVALPNLTEAKELIKKSVIEGTMHVVAITLIVRPRTDCTGAAEMWVPHRDGGTYRPPNDQDEVLSDEVARECLERFRSLTSPLMRADFQCDRTVHMHL